MFFCISIVLFCFISYFAIILDGVHLTGRATSAPIPTVHYCCYLFFLFFCFVATLCVNEDVYITSKVNQGGRVQCIVTVLVQCTSTKKAKRPRQQLTVSKPTGDEKEVILRSLGGEMPVISSQPPAEHDYGSNTLCHVINFEHSYATQ